MFDESDAGRTFSRGRSDLVRKGNDSRYARCQTFGIEIDGGLAVYEKPVAAEHYHGLNAGPLANGDCQVANCRHQGFVVRGTNLGIRGNLVNRIRLNCHELQGIIENRDGSVVPLPSMQVMTPRRFALALVASASILSACGDPQSLRASLPTVEDVYTVFALTGTPASFPSGINTYIRSAVRVDGFANFDVAFDIGADGNVKIFPVQKIVSSLSGARRVGLKKVAGTFDTVLEAPSGIYDDSVVVAKKGDVVVVQAQRNGSGDACQFGLSPYIYSKLLIDSVALATRTIVVRSVLDPNCGFRSFESGIPAK